MKRIEIQKKLSPFEAVKKERDEAIRAMIKMKLVVMGVANDLRREAKDRCDGDQNDFASKLATRLEAVAK